MIHYFEKDGFSLHYNNFTKREADVVLDIGCGIRPTTIIKSKKHIY